MQTNSKWAVIEAVICRRTSLGGYLRDVDVARLAADPDTRLTPVIVRCGGGRFVCPVQDAAHFIGIIERHAVQNGPDESDYVRDVSLAVRS